MELRPTFIVSHLLVIILLSGCSYRFGYSYRSLPGGHELVSIPVFKNKTSFVALEPSFTNALRAEFERSKIARVVSKNIAPVVLQGTIESLRYDRGVFVQGGAQYEDVANPALGTTAIPQLPKDTAIATEIRVYVTSSVKLVRSSDQKTLWTGSFTNEIVYSAPRIGTPVVNSSNANYNDSILKAKVTQLAENMMEEVHDRVTENF